MWQPPINKIYDMLSDYELIIEEFAKHVVLEYTTNKSLYEKYIIENMYKLYDITEILRKYNITEKELLNEKEKFLQINIDAFKEYNTINFNEIQIAIQQIKSCKE
jgi:predicted DNA-binding helix-hairpin-helix protein